MTIGKTYLEQSAAVRPGADGLVHIAAVDSLPAIAVTRSVALTFARALLAAVAALEDREAAPTPPTELRKEG